MGFLGLKFLVKKEGLREVLREKEWRIGREKEERKRKKRRGKEKKNGHARGHGHE
jgi:hypothetical protein